MASPVINIQPSNQKVVLGNTLSLSITATSALHYAWFQGAVPVGTDSSIYQNTTFANADRGLYHVNAINADGTTRSNDATVSTQPYITSQPTSQAFVIGSTATLPVGVTGYGPTYQWFKDRTSIVGATGNPLHLYPFADSSRGVYKVVIYDDGNDTTSSDATITTQTAVTVQPESAVLLLNADSTVTVTATGHNPLTYQWQKDSSSIQDATNRAYILTPYSAAKRGIYHVTVTGDGNSVTNSDATIGTQVRITSTPDKTATEHVAYSYQPISDVSTNSWALTGTPTGMSINAISGLVTWTPGYDRTNSGTLHLISTATDSTTTQDWTVAVTMISPALTSTPGETATEGVAYTYTPTYTAQDLWKFDLTGAPTGMTVNSTTGGISWVPNYDQTNSGSLRLRVYDLNGLNAYQDWTVASALVTPVITSTPDATAYANLNYSYGPTGTVTHFNTWALAGAPSGMQFDPSSGSINWTPAIDQTSSGRLILSLKSLNGLKADQTFTLTVYPEPAQTSSSQSGQACVSPFGVSYTRTNVWVMDSQTNLPVGFREEISF